MAVGKSGGYELAMDRLVFLSISLTWAGSDLTIESTILDSTAARQHDGRAAAQPLPSNPPRDHQAPPAVHTRTRYHTLATRLSPRSTAFPASSSPLVHTIRPRSLCILQSPQLTTLPTAIHPPIHPPIHLHQRGDPRYSANHAHSPSLNTHLRRAPYNQRNDQRARRRPRLDCLLHFPLGWACWQILLPHRRSKLAHPPPHPSDPRNQCSSPLVAG